MLSYKELLNIGYRDSEVLWDIKDMWDGRCGDCPVHGVVCASYKGSCREKHVEYFEAVDHLNCVTGFPIIVTLDNIEEYRDTHEMYDWDWYSSIASDWLRTTSTYFDKRAMTGGGDKYRATPKDVPDSLLLAFTTIKNKDVCEEKSRYEKAMQCMGRATRNYPSATFSMREHPVDKPAIDAWFKTLTRGIHHFGITNCFVPNGISSMEQLRKLDAMLDGYIIVDKYNVNEYEVDEALYSWALHDSGEWVESKFSFEWRKELMNKHSVSYRIKKLPTLPDASPTLDPMFTFKWDGSNFVENKEVATKLTEIKVVKYSKKSEYKIGDYVFKGKKVFIIEES